MENGVELKMRKQKLLSCAITLGFALYGLSLATHSVAQVVVNPGFKSVGRGAPLAVALPPVRLPRFVPGGPPPSAEAAKIAADDLAKYPFVGPMGPPPGAPGPRNMGLFSMQIGSAWNGDVPAGVQALPIDIFTSKDFYKDRDLWKDPRYFRCNSPQGLENQRGAVMAAMIGKDPPRTAAWGLCDRGLPREAIVSPYTFKTAQAHYEGLLAETTKRGGPTKHTYATVPGELNGRYAPSNFIENWYSMMLAVQFPTVLSVLTPEYQKRMVQDAYHQAVSNAPQWVSQYCWPEGFIRRWYSAAIQFPLSVIVTPSMVQVMAGVADNFVTNIHIGRQFRMDGVVPRLGPDVPRWFGETIGFWDKDVLVTWTSNIQGWSAHGAFEISSKMQTIEIYAPVRDAKRKVTALNHETIFYDPEALVEPIRIVRNYARLGEFTEGDPNVYIRCIPTIMPVKGKATPVSPGNVIEYEVPDMYGRPWAQMWEKYYEEGMERPKEEDVFSFK
jgi:hypothetical protein